METRLIKAFKAKIEAAIGENGNSILSGMCLDYPAYREGVGMLRGLNEALLLLEEAERDITGDR